MANPPCLHELLNQTSYCLISHLTMSLQIGEHVFCAYKTLASNSLHLLNCEPAWTEIFLQVVYWTDQKLFIALFWGSKKTQGACANTVDSNKSTACVCYYMASFKERFGLRSSWYAGVRMFPFCMAAVQSPHNSALLCSGTELSQRRCSNALHLEPPAKPLKLAEVILLSWRSMVK